MKKLSFALCLAGLVSACASDPVSPAHPLALTTFTVTRPAADSVVVSYKTNDGEVGGFSTALPQGHASLETCTDIISSATTTESPAGQTITVTPATICSGPLFQITSVPNGSASAAAGDDMYQIDFTLMRLDAIHSWSEAGAQVQLASTSRLRFNRMVHLPVGAAEDLRALPNQAVADAR